MPAVDLANQCPASVLHVAVEIQLLGSALAVLARPAKLVNSSILYEYSQQKLKL